MSAVTYCRTWEEHTLAGHFVITQWVDDKGLPHPRPNHTDGPWYQKHRIEKDGSKVLVEERWEKSGKIHREDTPTCLLRQDPTPIKTEWRGPGLECWLRREKEPTPIKTEWYGPIPTIPLRHEKESKPIKTKWYKPIKPEWRGR